MLENQTIVFLSGVRWEFSWQRHQQLAVLFSRQNRVLFVETALSPANLFREPGTTLRHWQNWLRGIRRENDRLWIYSSPPVLPFGRNFFTLQRINQKLIFHSVRAALRKLNLTAPLVWISDPYISAFTRLLSPRLIAFDWIHDQGRNDMSRRGRVYRALLAEARKEADVIFTPSRVIYDRYGGSDPRCAYVPNAADSALFSSRASFSPPPEAASIAAPWIGFIGTVGPAIDQELVEGLARRKPGWSFIFIGEVRQNLPGLKSFTNVHFLGPRPREELPRYLACFSAGIIPYRVVPETETVHPVKTYEYLAAGLPVVSTDLAELKSLAGVIELAVTADDFLGCLEKNISGNNSERRAKRQDFARTHSWEAQMEMIGETMARALGER